jgi:hypothetical protein
VESAVNRAINWHRPQFRRAVHGSVDKRDLAERIKHDAAARWLEAHDPQQHHQHHRYRRDREERR